MTTAVGLHQDLESAQAGPAESRASPLSAQRLPEGVQDNCTSCSTDILSQIPSLCSQQQLLQQ